MFPNATLKSVLFSSEGCLHCLAFMPRRFLYHSFCTNYFQAYSFSLWHRKFPPIPHASTWGCSPEICFPEATLRFGHRGFVTEVLFIVYLRSYFCLLFVRHLQRADYILLSYLLSSHLRLRILTNNLRNSKRASIKQRMRNED